jgi:flagellin
MITLLSNAASTQTQRHMSISQRNLNKSLGRLASGLRIVRAADDAAGLAISENLRAQVRSLSVARRNASDGISMAQTAEGALNETHGLLTRMRELAVQSANGTLGTEQRAMIAQEFGALRDEIDRIANVTEFNGISLLNSVSQKQLQVGINNSPDDRLTVSTSNMRVSSLVTGGALSTASVSAQATARVALSTIDDAINKVSQVRATFGIVQNRLEVTLDRLHSAEENLGAANSRIRDADIASETSSMTRNQILVQAGVSMLGQANQLPGIAMSLIGG